MSWRMPMRVRISQPVPHRTEKPMTPEAFARLKEYTSALTTQFATNHPDWRMGQCVFNALHRIRPDIADKYVRATACDPFYQDHKITDMWSELQARLVE
jgi:hypothetical protein